MTMKPAMMNSTSAAAVDSERNWLWVDARFARYLTGWTTERAMGVDSRDRFHAKQGRSTARVILHPSDPDHRLGDRPISVYLKRHFERSFPERITGTRSPAEVERQNLERVRALGINVPEVVALGGRVAETGDQQSFLMVLELSGQGALNELLPGLERGMAPADFAALKRALAREIARIAAAIHRRNVFHSDLYLCHFFLDPALADRDPRSPRLALIDLHRAIESRFTAPYRRIKDLGQLLYSTEEVAAIDDRDRLRFLVHYCRYAGVRRPGLLAWLVRLRAGRYSAHNRGSGRGKRLGRFLSLWQG